MEEQKVNFHHPLSKELITIVEENAPKQNKNQRYFKRLNTYNDFNRNSLFSIRKTNVTTPKIERTFSNKKENDFISPIKIEKKEKDSNFDLNNYLFTIEKNKKHKLYKNMIPNILTDENESEDLNTNYNSIKIENKNYYKFDKKINEIYSMYQKTYDSSIETIKNKFSSNTISQSLTNKIKTFKNNHEFNNSTTKTKIQNIDNRNKFISNNIQSKTLDKAITNQSLKLSHKYNFFANTRKKIYRLRNTKGNTMKYRTSLTEGNNINHRALITISKKKTDSYIRSKVSDLIKSLNIKNNSEFYILKRQERDEKKKSKMQMINKTQDVRHKLVSLLNKPKKGDDNDDIKLFPKKRIRSDNPMLIRKPTNNIEMNNLIINSFGAGYNHNEYSKKIFNLNETFFSLLENMKQRRAEMDIVKFEKEKNKYLKDEFQKKNYEIYFQKNNRDKWEKKFMLDQYHYKIPEKEFKKFKKSKQNELKKKIAKDSKKLSELITNMDAEEYELPDAICKYYKSTKQSISMKNVKRIHRVHKILKNIEDEEQTGKIIINADKLKKEQKKIETEIIGAIGRGGKPRFVKSLFKPRTIRKYKGISGNYFGLPA